jgi:hypothetical protein
MMILRGTQWTWKKNIWNQKKWPGTKSVEVTEKTMILFEILNGTKTKDIGKNTENSGRYRHR